MNRYIDLFLDSLKTENAASKNTISSYTFDLIEFFKFYTLNYSDQDFINACEGQIISYINHISEFKKKSSIQRAISSIKQFYKFLVRDGVIKINPIIMINAPKKSLQLPKIISVETVNQLLNQANYMKYCDGLRFKLILYLLYGSGLRVSELISIKYSMFEGRFLRICGKGSKERSVPISQKLINLINEVRVFVNCKDYDVKNQCIENDNCDQQSGELKNSESQNSELQKSDQQNADSQGIKELYKYKEFQNENGEKKNAFLKNGRKINNDIFINENTYLFPSLKCPSRPITRQRVFQIIKQACMDANIDHSKISPHVLRHAFATHVLDNGADLMSVKKMLGHSDIATTQIYTHVTTKKLRKVIEQHHPMARKKSIG